MSTGYAISCILELNRKEKLIKEGFKAKEPQKIDSIMKNPEQSQKEMLYTDFWFNINQKNISF